MCKVCQAFEPCDADGVCLICYAWKQREVEGQYEWRVAIANHVARVFQESDDRDSRRIFSIGFHADDEDRAEAIGLMTVGKDLFQLRLLSRDEMVARGAMEVPFVIETDITPIEDKKRIQICRMVLQDNIGGDTFAALLAHRYGRTVWPWLRYRVPLSIELEGFAVRLCVELDRRGIENWSTMFRLWEDIGGERFFRPVAAEFRRLSLRLQGNPPTVLVLD